MDIFDKYPLREWVATWHVFLLFILLKDLIDPNIRLSEQKFLDYVLQRGIDKVTKDELIQIVNAHKLATWQVIPGFNELFYYKMAEENNRGIEKWTTIMGVLTALMAIMTAIQLYKLFNP